MIELPMPVREAFDATNAGDLERFTAAFADDGVLDDWGREFRGRDEIARWSREESIGVHQTFEVTESRVIGDDVIVTADVGGEGFNGPSTFTFRLDADGRHIERMAITA
ncbi:nuclear transport factor 2 family protein [Agromyces ramosus]|uniref:Uncharacterized protein (TIGR02246 family) n=1 Tax=Agromyces ramosus TaxID=33879 RepID=A0ABU0R487_9MICO|nr:nuclear transport factor 2 family protein [Agromyces ramosus]MDQ0892888.1 uncharacterized protein (TIGR02246 family) [Agromyces ramosus]